MEPLREKTLPKLKWLEKRSEKKENMEGISGIQ